MSRQTKTPPTRTTLRCAIYTRKSTEEGLEQEFNSLDAQREAGELFVRSQAGEGWALLPDRYDDGGFTGGNMERPALRRLMADLQAGKVDAVVVYKVDRLSRSLQVKVRPDGFEYEGEVHASLSAVAKAITGSHCNGFNFFRLTRSHA